MKKHIKYIVLSALAFVGCQKDVEPDVSFNSQASLNVTLPTDNIDSRVSFSDGESSISLSWEAGDSFTVYDSTGSKVDDYFYYAAGDNNSATFVTEDSTNSLNAGDTYTAVCPAIEGVTTLAAHRTALAAKVLEQTQKGNNSTDHLNDALRMEAQFTYSDASTTQVNFVHTMATMRVTFKLDSAATLSTVQFKDGEYAAYNLNINDAESTDTHTAYFIINPNEGGNRNLIYNIVTTEGEEMYFMVECTKSYSVGTSYIASINSLNTGNIPDGYKLIYTAEEFNNIREDMTGKYYLMNDISLSEYSNWTPIGSETTPFTGSFDGGGHTISDLTINTTYSYQALFGYVGETTTIEDLILDEPSITGATYIGGVVGYATKGSKILDCGVEGGSVTGTGSYIGGVAGCSSTISNCYNTGDIVGGGNVGGVAGCIGYSTSFCYNTGNITSDSGSVGGVFGNTKESGLYSITSCYNTGNVLGTISNNVGGVVGSADSYHLTDCYNIGDVSGSSNVGGVVGSKNAENAFVTSCYNTGKIEGTGECIGGVAGQGSFNRRSCFFSCYNTGSVLGGENVGGVAGCGGPFTDCYNIGNINGGINVGGVVGESYNRSTITTCYNAGDINCTKNAANGVFETRGNTVGGVVGFAKAIINITACYNIGNVTGERSVGGIAGVVTKSYGASASLTACYNTGGVSSTYGGSIGGVVGTATDIYFTSCYNSASVTGTGDNIGGVIGSATHSTASSSYIISCYYRPYSDVTYTSKTDGTAEEELITTMKSTNFVSTLNTAAESDHFEQDDKNCNDGFPILISIDYK